MSPQQRRTYDRFDTSNLQESVVCGVAMALLAPYIAITLGSRPGDTSWSWALFVAAILFVAIGVLPIISMMVVRHNKGLPVLPPLFKY